MVAVLIGVGHNREGEAWVVGVRTLTQENVCDVGISTSPQPQDQLRMVSK